MSSLPPCLSWFTVALRALTRIVFVPRASRRRCALAVALHRRDSGLGIRMHETTHTYTHTTSANAVTLVWGSLRLAPTSKALPSISGLYWYQAMPSKSYSRLHCAWLYRGYNPGPLFIFANQQAKLLMISKCLLLFQVALNWG